ncbi:MAG TPA: NAD-dependent succinate-semialdehyde dehydrogenase [Gemmatimonadaceae bacterium]|nr:NAD-dependent succinate-semialdehyde dehydrogenase [Gemmatimonadaceae bacterium]
MITSVNPATGATLATFAPHDAEDVEERLARAAETFRRYRLTSMEERERWMRATASLLDRDQRPLARTMTEEMGKTIRAARAEVEKCAWVCRYYADHAARFLADEAVEAGEGRSRVSYQPIGPVLAVMPWNFPFWQVFRFAVPALMAGNVGLLKHASNVPRCALEIERLFREGGFPEGAFQTLLIGASQVAGVIADARIAAATLTGSEPAGSSVAREAGARIKKTVLELGGSDPFIVMPSADIAAAVRTAVTARTINNGQSCIAAKRFIVHEDVAERFERELAAGMEQLRVGDPMDESTDVGPLATPAILEQLEEQVRRTVDAGASVLTGGQRLDRPGNFYAPTVLTNIPPGTPARCEEMFGPVAACFRVRDVDEAIALANDSAFGLGASAWTRDAKEQERFARDLESGLVFINAMVASDPRLPFGGVKRSGYGRELGAWGIREFVNIKTIVVRG